MRPVSVERSIILNSSLPKMREKTVCASSAPASPLAETSRRMMLPLLRRMGVHISPFSGALPETIAEYFFSISPFAIAAPRKAAANAVRAVKTMPLVSLSSRLTARKT